LNIFLSNTSSSSNSRRYDFAAIKTIWRWEKEYFSTACWWERTRYKRGVLGY